MPLRRLERMDERGEEGGEDLSWMCLRGHVRRKDGKMAKGDREDDVMMGGESVSR